MGIDHLSIEKKRYHLPRRCRQKQNEWKPQKQPDPSLFETVEPSAFRHAASGGDATRTGRTGTGLTGGVHRFPVVDQSESKLWSKFCGNPNPKRSMTSTMVPLHLSYWEIKFGNELNSVYVISCTHRIVECHHSNGS